MCCVQRAFGATKAATIRCWNKMANTWYYGSTTGVPNSRLYQIMVAATAVKVWFNPGHNFKEYNSTLKILKVLNKR